MLIDAAPRAANNSHTASDAKGVVMMNEGPHRTPQKKNIDHKATSSKIMFAKNIQSCMWFCQRDFCRPSSNSQTHATCSVSVHSLTPVLRYSLHTTEIIPTVAPIVAIANSGDHDPRRKEIKSSYMRKLTCMDVSENRGTPKSSISNRVFHYKPSILGYPYFWKHPYLIPQNQKILSQALGVC